MRKILKFKFWVPVLAVLWGLTPLGMIYIGFVFVFFPSAIEDTNIILRLMGLFWFAFAIKTIKEMYLAVKNSDEK